jgi:putative aldouronate transport system substrate-binding protein
MWGTNVNGDYSAPYPPIPGVPTDWWNGIVPLVAPKANGGGPAAQWQGSAGGGGIGNFGIFAIPASVGKSNKAKVKELLRILNYVSAPFGSKEYTFMEYGIEGWNFTYVGGVPVGTSHSNELAAHYFTEPEDNVLYLPYFAQPPDKDLQSFSLTAQQLLEKLVPDSVGDPSATLVSPTYISQGPNLQQQLNSAFVDVVTGRAGGTVTSGLKNMISQWKSQGGDKMRSEFEAALAKSKK